MSRRPKMTSRDARCGWSKEGDADARAWRRAANLRHLTEARDLLRRHGFARIDDYLAGDAGWVWRPAHPTLQREPPRVLCLHESEPHAWEGVAVQETEGALEQVRLVCEQVRACTLDLGPYEADELRAWLWWAEDGALGARAWADVCSVVPGCGECPACEAAADLLWLGRWAEVLRAEMRSRSREENG